MTTTTVYSVNAYLSGLNGIPEGVTIARIKTPFVATAHNTSRRLLHRPRSAVRAEVFARRGDSKKVQIGARFLCGSFSIDVIPVADAEWMDTCPKCDRLSGEHVERWTIYRYDDADGQPLYVGLSSDLAGRHKSHRDRSPWFSQYAALSVLSTHGDRRAALIAERDAIRSLTPRFNIVHNRRSS